MNDGTEQTIMLMQERVGDSAWKTLCYTDGMHWQRADDWSKVEPRQLSIDGFPVYRRLVTVPPKEWVTFPNELAKGPCNDPL